MNLNIFNRNVCQIKTDDFVPIYVTVPMCEPRIINAPFEIRKNYRLWFL